MKQLLLLIISVLFTTAVMAQSAIISGKVVDNNNTPVEGATVIIRELNKATITDANGAYELKAVKNGEYTLTISSITTELENRKIKVQGNTQVVNVKVKHKKDQELSEVNVNGKSVKREIETSGFAVNVVNTKEASLRNLQTNELLNRTVGVRVRQSAGFGSDANYNLNGMSGRAIGIFIDGIEISTYGSSFNLNNIPPSMIDRIEVYKGVLPANLTGDYLGGGINVILKKGAQRNNLTASVSYGSFNTQQADLSGMFRDPKTGFTFRGSGFYGYSDNDYEVWSKWVKNLQPNLSEKQTRGKRFNDAYKSFGGRAEAGFTNVKWADNFMLSYNFSDTYDEVQHGQYMSVPYKGRFSKSQAHVLGLDYRKSDLFINGLNFTFNGVYSDREQYIQDTVSFRYNWDGKVAMAQRQGEAPQPVKLSSGAQQGSPTMNTINRQIATLRSSLSYNIIENHKITYNHMFYVVDRSDRDVLKSVLEQTYMNTNDLTKNVAALSYEAAMFNGRLRTNLFGKHYMQKVERTEPVSEVVGGRPTRVDRITTDNRNTTGYGFAASYTLKPNFIIIASAEKAVRMPDESEVFGNQAENLLPNPLIRPEMSNNYNLGFRAGTYNFGQHKLSISASGFLRNTTDKIAIRSNDRPVTVMATSESINLPGTQSIGFEAEFNYTYRRLNVTLNTSKFNTLVKDRSSIIYNEQIPNEPFFTVNGNAQYRLNSVIQKNSALNLYYNFGFVSPFQTVWIPANRRDDYYETPTQFVQDVGASYMLPNKKLVISFDAKNILNAEAYDNFASQRPGRAFYLKLNYTINNF